MRTIRFYSICVFLFSFVSVLAQGVAFEGLHLDNLILDPGERKPGFRDFQSDALYVPRLGDVLSKDLMVKYVQKDFSFKKDPYHAGKLSLHLHTTKSPTSYRSITRLYSTGVEVGMSYKISKSLELKGGVFYQYNIALKRWEWTCLTGVIFHF